LNILDLGALCDLDRPDLKYKPLRAVRPKSLIEAKSVFDVIKRGDVLLHHPYTDYSMVTNFIRAAASDPKYWRSRLFVSHGQQSEIAEILRQAGEQGKQVTALIE